MVQSQILSLTIGQLATRAGVNVETVRYYQRLGLLDTPQKVGAVRRYGQQHLHTLSFIQNAKQADFTLREIAALIALDASTDHQKARSIAAQKIAAIDKKLAALTKAKTSLLQVITECERSAPNAPCAILQKFDSSQ